MNIYAGYSLFASILRVLYNKGYSIYNNPVITYNVKRLENKSLTQSLYEHTTAPLSNITKISNHIYLGNAYNAANYSDILSHNIDIIINVTDDLFNYFENDINLKYYSLSVQDINEDSISKYFDIFIEIIENNQDSNILIHCLMGHSRSVTLVLIYLVIFKNLYIHDAIEYIKEKRPTININKTFYNQAKEYIKKRRSFLTPDDDVNT